ncbi:MAG TPA: hypothetical protein VEL28_12860 [Candidatus Binatia bacterium]|nr:hypothetical protein [Candidatus Binatia bacterium]
MKTSTPGTDDFDGTAKTAFLDRLNDLANGGANCFAGHCDWRLPSEEGLGTPGAASQHSAEEEGMAAWQRSRGDQRFSVASSRNSWM